MGCGDDYWVIKLDATGNQVWDNTVGGLGKDGASCISTTTDGGIMVGGHSYSPNYCDKTEWMLGSGADYWVAKLNGAGTLEWQNNIGSYSEDLLQSIQQTTDGGYLLGGYSNSAWSPDKSELSAGYYDFWIIKTNDSGTIEWENTIGGCGKEELGLVMQTNEGSFLIAGNTRSYMPCGDLTVSTHGKADFIIMKLATDYNLVQGSMYFDFNNNLQQDPFEIPISNHPILEQTSGKITLSHSNGEYDLHLLDPGTCEILPAPLIYYSPLPSNLTLTFPDLNFIDTANHFAFQPTVLINDLEIDISTVTAFRPGFNASYNLTCLSKGTVSTSAIVTLYLNDYVTYQSSSLIPTLISTDSVVWEISSMIPFQDTDLLVNVTVLAMTPIGYLLSSKASVKPGETDMPEVINNTSNNDDTGDIIVTGSTDPNDILVDKHILDVSETPNPPYLEYIIRFQNTGTDTAFNIKVFNEIPSTIDLISFELISSSHPVEIEWNDLAQQLEFYFDDILLPDSNINEEASHGFVVYRVKPVNSLLIGDSVINSAAIFFDFNAPVLTNDAVTEVTMATGLSPSAQVNSLSVFPNPGFGTVIVSSALELKGSLRMYVYDACGKEILNEEIKNPDQITVDVSSWTGGVYIFRLQNHEMAAGTIMVKE